MLLLQDDQLTKKKMGRSSIRVCSFLSIDGGATYTKVSGGVSFMLLLCFSSNATVRAHNDPTSSAPAPVSILAQTRLRMQREKGAEASTN